MTMVEGATLSQAAILSAVDRHLDLEGQTLNLGPWNLAKMDPYEPATQAVFSLSLTQGLSGSPKFDPSTIDALTPVHPLPAHNVIARTGMDSEARRLTAAGCS